MLYIMKKLLHLFALLLFFSASFAQSKEEMASASKILYTKISWMDQPDFSQEIYAELAYLKRIYHLDSFNLNNSRYISKMNDFYYRRFYLFSKLLDENAIVTEDCFQDDANKNLHAARKMLPYCIYPNSIKLPKNIVEQLDEYATIDEFFGPYNSLNTIYFLKKYNYSNLSAAQKTKLEGIEKFLSNLMYTKYVQNKPWSYYRFLSLKVLKMNNSELVKNIGFSDIVAYLNNNPMAPLALSDTDRADVALMKKAGGKDFLPQIANSILWIILLELNKN